MAHRAAPGDERQRAGRGGRVPGRLLGGGLDDGVVQLAGEHHGGEVPAVVVDLRVLAAGPPHVQEQPSAVGAELGQGQLDEAVRVSDGRTGGGWVERSVEAAEQRRGERGPRQFGRDGGWRPGRAAPTADLVDRSVLARSVSSPFTLTASPSHLASTHGGARPPRAERNQPAHPAAGRPAHPGHGGERGSANG